jgi:RNA polymerase sigma-70 factor (ECF subfamily)
VPERSGHITGEDDATESCWLQSAVERYEGQLVRYAARLTGDVEQARDVVQETFLRLCREDRAELDGHLAQWLFTVCRNRALDVRQKESRMQPLSAERLNHVAVPSGDQASALEAQETVDRVSALLRQLPGNQQEVIRLKFQNGLSYREISEITKLSVSNVGYLIHTAVKTIRERVVLYSE